MLELWTYKVGAVLPQLSTREATTCAYAVTNHIKELAIAGKPIPDSLKILPFVSAKEGSCQLRKESRPGNAGC